MVNTVRNTVLFGAKPNVESRMLSTEIAMIVGKQHKDVMRAIRKMEPAWEMSRRRKFALATYIDEQGKPRPCYSLTQLECLYIATKFNDKARADLVIRWEDLERERLEREHQAMRESEHYSLIDDKMKFAEWSASFLNMNENSKLLLAMEIGKEVGLDHALPSYTISNGVLKPISALLKQFGIPMSAQAANKRLLEKGLLRVCTRKSHKGEKNYYNITEKGMSYGENQVSPQNPSETQPMWYEDKFNIVADMIK